MIQVVENAYQPHGAMAATVVVKADSFEEAAGGPVKKLAIAYAKERGLNVTGYSGTTSPYPCDRDGKPSDAVLKGATPVDHYRIDIRLQGSF